MRKEAIAKQENAGEDGASDAVSKYRVQVDKEMERQKKIDQEHFGSAQFQRMEALKGRVVSLFKERDVTFFDCFVNVYDPLNQSASIISISDFKRRIR
mmetsp:Transcript_42490/g.65159  ORF Transcript_42490/g.65159 Transcript_42490/m.65159 type:complete len:98 (-) Transcript_42490:1280-1573(-)